MLIGTRNHKLNTETGEFTNFFDKGKIPLTGIPIMISWNILHDLVVHYDDHIDCFHCSSVHLKREYMYDSLSIGDPTYLGHCYESIGSCPYFKKGNDLVCGLYQPQYRTDHPITYENFFDNCQVLLFVTNPEFEFPNELPLDHIPHYIDLQGNVHGRNPACVKKGEYYIIFDVYLCICNDIGQVCVITDYTQQKYQEVIGLNITKIDIFPDTCQIFAEEGRFILNSQGVHRDAELDIIVRRPTNIKSARKW